MDTQVDGYGEWMLSCTNMVFLLFFLFGVCGKSPARRWTFSGVGQEPWADLRLDTG